MLGVTPWATAATTDAAQPPSHTVDCHDETPYDHLRDDGKAFLAWVLAFISPSAVRFHPKTPATVAGPDTPAA